ncbi:uncharacterized protein LOC117119374 [Anneissia japonica]|uniref:uncharacterized protein LOC117119374 n=1 Tax=Anneissia japonica TaxID=1529436 RepID=UPI0014257965|nr:uncharacterized protein LOC117119374 [Anneissia japonica]
MKLLVCILILSCFAKHASGQWNRRWFRQSSWYSYPSGGRVGWNTWPTTGWVDNSWTSMPAGWVDTSWSTVPTGWTGSRDSWYDWYSWYNFNSWQGAPSVGTGNVQPTSAGSPNFNNPSTRPSIPLNSRPDNTPVRPPRPRNANERNRPGQGGNRPRPFRYKRDIEASSENDNVVPMGKQMPDSVFDLMRDPRRRAANKMEKSVEPNPTEIKCPRTYRPVCGTNNRTYNNPCDLMKAGDEDVCLDFAYDGECTIDTKIVCFDCQEEDAQLRLTKNVLQLTGFDDWFSYNMAVCGTDGNTYISMCDLCKRKCLDSNEQLRRKHSGQCGAPFPFVGGN